MEHRFQAHGLPWLGLPGFRAGVSSCGAWAGLLHGMCDLPGAGIQPVSPALTGGFFTTEPLEKPPHFDPVFKESLDFFLSH